MSILDADTCEIVEQKEHAKMKFSAVGNQCMSRAHGRVVGLVSGGKDNDRVFLLEYMEGKMKILQRLGMDKV